MNAVKIIKSKNRPQVESVEPSRNGVNKTVVNRKVRDAATETVVNWIAEWREKKTIDARRSFADLFDRAALGESSGLFAANGK